MVESSSDSAECLRVTQRLDAFLNVLLRFEQLPHKLVAAHRRIENFARHRKVQFELHADILRDGCALRGRVVHELAILREGLAHRLMIALEYRGGTIGVADIFPVGSGLQIHGY